MRTEAGALRSALAKLPSGWAFPATPDSNTARLLTPLAHEAVRFEQSAEALLQEVDPGRAGPLLVDYERVLGPDPCRGDAPAGLVERRLSARQRWTARGGSSRAFFIGVAAQLGVPIAIREFRPFRIGRSRIGTPLYGQGWAFTWEVTAPRGLEVPFRIGQSAVGEPLRSFVGPPLACVFDRLKPAHTTLRITFSGAA